MTYPNGPAFLIGYNETMTMFSFEVTVPNDIFFGIGFGENMTNTDMIMFEANGTGAIRDLWSTGELKKPSVDLF